MALERVFACPRTLRRLRRGPLGKLLEGFCNWLLEHGFRRHTIRQHLFNVSHLNDHLNGEREESTRASAPERLRAFSGRTLCGAGTGEPQKNTCVGWATR